MSLKPLLKKQKITIDDHKRGCREQKSWDDKTVDVHLDKTTKTRINGKHQEVRIKIPINSDKKISIERAKKEIDEIPSKLKKEIIDAFNDKKIREDFIEDLVSILKNYESHAKNEDKAKEALRRISKHFGLDWDENDVTTHYDSAQKRCLSIIKDEQNDYYSAYIDNEKMIFEDVKNVEKKVCCFLSGCNNCDHF